jgi:beta-glucosidase
MAGTLSMDTFVDSLSDHELAILTCGNAEGWIGYIPEKGIPEAYWSDGPVGLRQPFNVTVYPSGTMVSSSWNTELAVEYGRAIGAEANLYNIDVWLAPAMNIHRDPCCGRNFEYHSEDPCLTATIVSEMVKGVQECGVAATIKHFAANNTEYQRLRSNSRIAARAFREIYARAFERVIRDSDPYSVMTSYNYINGIKSSEDPVLCKTIMRDEFGFKGVLMSDFGNDSVHVKELAAEHDLKMHFGDPRSVEAALADGSLSKESVRKCVKRILEMISKTAGKRM